MVQKVQDGQSRAPQIMAIESTVPLVGITPSFQCRTEESCGRSFDLARSRSGITGAGWSGKTLVLATNVREPNETATP